MAPFLHKLGAAAFNHSWRVISVWVVILGLLGFTAFQFMKPTSAEISIPGTDAQKAIDRAGELFPNGGKGTGRVVFQTHNGQTITAQNPDIQAVLNDIKEVDGIAQVAGPADAPSFIADSGTIAYAQVQLEKTAGATSESTITRVNEIVNAARTSDLQIEIAGDLINKAPAEILGVGEIAGVAIALLVLVMTLGSLIAAGMPILTALTGVAISMAGLFSMSQLFTISSTTPVLAVMLGLAVGIDYALFILNKYRSYVLIGYGFEQAAAKAIGTAGNAVVFAALTVVIALAALSIVNIPFMTTMGLVGAGSIAIAALVAITLTPALLGLAKGRIFGKKARATVLAAQKRGPANTDYVSHSSVWYRWGAAITKRPVPVLLVAILLLGIIALPARDLQLGLPTDQYAPSDSTQRKAYDILSNGFGVGFNGPLTVVVEGLPQVSDADKQLVRQKAMDEYTKQVAAATAAQQETFQKLATQATTLEQQVALQEQITEAKANGEKQQQAAMTQIDKTVEEYAKYVQLQKTADAIGKLDNVKQTQPALVTSAGTAGIIQVIPNSAPADQATSNLIAKLRAPNTQREIAGSATLAVTGSTALQEDISAKLGAALPQYLAIVVGLSLVLLIIAFRSIIVPLKATLGFLLSVAAMFGALVAVFQWGWFGITDAPGPIVSFIPIIAIGILFGLAMDYEFFLVSGMHEAYAHAKDAKQAVVRGFGMGSKVVTAAGIIMVSVFAGFITNHDATIQAMGFGLAIGILIDAFIVRMTIVPAVMALLGKAAWWLPKWLDRRLPHISIEGEESK